MEIYKSHELTEIARAITVRGCGNIKDQKTHMSYAPSVH